MRLKRLRLANYGCFAELELQLATEPGRITLITAPNGAGKSVLRQAFHDLLFDIPVQSPMKFRHGYAGMTLQADAVADDGVPFRFGWERGGKPARVTDDLVRFNALRQGVTPEQLERLFALDTANLRKWGTNLKGGATLAEALLAGTGELASAKKVLGTIDKRRQENWGKGKSLPPLNAAASRLEEARAQLRRAVVAPEARGREEQALSMQQHALQQARQERAAAAAETSRLNRIALTRAPLSMLDEAEAWLRAHPDAPALPPGLDVRLAAARADLVLARERHRGAEDAARRAVEAVDRIERDGPCTRLADRLAKLSGLLGETEKAGKDLVGLRTKHAAEMDGARRALQSIGSDLPVHRAAELVPTVALKAEAQAATTAEAKLRTALELARTGLARAEAAQRRASQDLTAVEPLPDGLDALVKEIRADRDPVKHAEEVDARAIAGAADVRQSLARVPGWAGTAEALRALPLAPDTAFERLDAARSGAALQAEAARARALEAAARDRDARTRLAGLQAHDLPDMASVLAARADRDRGMRLVLARAFGTAPSPAEEAGFAGDEPLPLAYERRVRAADALADRRTAELERVQEAERLSLEIEGLAEPLHRAEADAVQAAAMLAETERAWAEAIAPLGLGAHTSAAELRQAGAARRVVVDALHAAEIASDTQAALARRHLGWAERLAGCLGVGMAPLGSLLAAAERRVGATQKGEQAVIKRQAELEGARRSVRETAGTHDEAVATLADWQTGWAALLARLRRPLDESPAAVLAVLAEITTLQGHLGAAQALAGRIGDIEADQARFAATVASLAREADHVERATPTGTARDLVERATAAARAEAAWGQASDTSQAALRMEGHAGEALRAAQTALDAVVAACGAADAEGAEARIAASRAHADHVMLRDGARAKLIEHGDGLDAAVLRSEAAAVPMEEMTPRKEAAGREAEVAQQRAEEAATALSQTQAALADAATSLTATEALASHEAAVTAFGRALEEQLVLQLASTMLADAMREVEDTMGGTALARTSAAFSAVTDGAYALEHHDGQAGEELYAVQLAYPKELKALTELSEGTRDQLYLALRMEALRGHCQSAMPVPFIADDILQTFDDARAAAALRALCALSADLQVIVLTHHGHLAGIAGTLPAGSVHCLELPR